MKEPLKICISLNLDYAINRYHKTLQGIQNYAKANTDWILVWDHYPHLLLNETAVGDKPVYDGVIGRIKYPAYEQMKRLSIPGVNLWTNSEISELPSVFPDFYQSGILAAEHLIRRGFKNFINIDSTEKAASVFLAGIKEALKPYKYKVKRYRTNRLFSETENAWRKQKDLFRSWIEEWEYPLAICSSASSSGPAIVTHCRENNIRIPQDVALVTVGQEESYCESIDPHLSCVETDYVMVGYEAAKMLHMQLKGIIVDNEHVLVQPKGLIARASTDTYTTEDEVVRETLRYIADNIHKNILVSDLVANVAISRRSLEYRFQRSIGHNMTDEINSLRIISMKRLLADSSCKINTLYKQAGFSSALHMRRVFTKITGMTPSVYRRSLKNDFK